MEPSCGPDSPVYVWGEGVGLKRLGDIAGRPARADALEVMVGRDCLGRAREAFLRGGWRLTSVRSGAGPTAVTVRARKGG